MTAGFSGALDEPLQWLLALPGKMVLRVRRGAPTPDDWYVLTPALPQSVPVGNQTVTVALTPITTVTDLGASLVITGGGAHDVDITAFLDVGTTTPSWIYLGAIAQTVPLPASTTIRVTTPAATLPSSTHTAIAAHIDTSGAGKALAVRLGRADLPVGQVTAKNTGTTITVPAADTGDVALSNPLVPSMTDVIAALGRPVATTDLGAVTCDLTLDAIDKTASGQPATTQLNWTATEILTVGAILATKDPAPRLGLDHRTNLVALTASSLPKVTAVTLNAMPDIGFGAASPDPAQAAPAVVYSANGRLAALDLTMSSTGQPVSPAPPGGTPAPKSSAHVVLADVPRAATLHVGQWNPNHPDDSYVDLALHDQNGAVDTLGHLTFSARPTAAPPLLPPVGTTQVLTVDAFDSSVVGDIGGLRRATSRVEPRQVTTMDVAYTANAVHPALLTLKGTDKGKTTVAATPLPAGWTFIAHVPKLAALQTSTTAWTADATWKGGATIPQLVITRTPAPTPGNQDQLELNATVTDLPEVVEVRGKNTTSAITELVWQGLTTVTSLVGAATVTAYSQPTAPFLTVSGSVAPLPRGMLLVLNRSTPGLDVRYGGSEVIDSADVTVRTTGLIAPDPDRYVPYDHARVVLSGVPATVTDPLQVDSGPQLVGLLDTQGGLVAGFEVPATIAPLGKAHLRVVDNRPSDTDGDAFASPAGVRQVNRPLPAPGQPDDLPGAPVGGLIVVTAPRLRSARFDGRDGQSLPVTYTICRGTAAGERAFGVSVELDDPVPIDVELALDSGDTSTWVASTVSEIHSVALDGQLAGSAGGGSYLAVELLPRGAQVDGVLKTYDRSPDATPPLGPDPTSVATGRLLRSTLAHADVALTDRVEARLNSPAAKLDLLSGMATSEPPQRVGTQLAGGAAAILTTPPPNTELLSGWVSGQHGFDEDVELWKSFRNDPQPRVLYDVRRNTTATVLPGGPAEQPREVHDFGVGPSGLLTTSVTGATVLARIQELRGLEVSTQGTLPSVGSRRTQRFVATWAHESWAIPFAAQHRENGVPTSDQFRGEVSHLDQRTELRLTPEAFRTENGTLAWKAHVQIGNVQLTAAGAWANGFPHISPPITTPVLMVNPSIHRPEGLTALDVSHLQLRRDLELERHRHWTKISDGLYDQRDSWHVRSGAGTDVRGWFVTDRLLEPLPGQQHPFVTFLASQLTTHPGPLISAIQGGVRIPDYNQPASQVSDNPLFMRPGESASPHSYAISLTQLQELTFSSGQLVDDTQREVPVFLSDDSAGFQEGTTTTDISLRVGGPPAPALVEIVSWEFDDWQDSPPQDRTDSLKISAVLPNLVAYSKTATVTHVPGKRPTATSETIVSTGAGIMDTNGPALGAGSLTVAQLDTSANPFAPVVGTVQADLTATPGYVRLVLDRHVSVGTFPDGGSTDLDAPGFDSEGAFDGGHASTHLTRAWASGPFAGTIMIVSPDFRLSRSSEPDPWKPPRFDLSRSDIELTATPVGPVDAANAPFALATSVFDASGTDAIAGLALFARCGALTLDGKITTSARYGQEYSSDFPAPTINLGDDAAVLSLDSFSGKATLQPQGTAHLLFDALIGAAAVAAIAMSLGGLLGGFLGGGLFGIALAELALLDVLEHQSPVRIDDLCGGSFFLTPRPSTALYCLGPVTNGWGHDKEPYGWDLDIETWLLVPMLIEWGWDQL